MRRIALLSAMLLVLAACGTTDPTDTTAVGPTTSTDATTTVPSETTTTESDGFPVTVSVANGEVEIPARPKSIVSLSASATENLFAVGAGDQVVAVDDQSNYPEDAPQTDLSGFTPNLESILAFEPDLVVVTFDPGGLLDGLAAVGVPTLLLPSATSVDDAFSEIEVLGAATGNVANAALVVADMQTSIASVVAEHRDQLEGTTIYHEVDNTLYSVSSSSYVGELYDMLGLVNIADEADPNGSGYPQLSAEYIVEQDPDVIILADALFGESIETLRERPGWGDLTALQNDAVVEADPDLASRWTPRSVEFMGQIAESIAALVPVG